VRQDDPVTNARPLLDALLDMNAASISRVGIAPRDLMAVRLAALAAVDAPRSSYLMNVQASAEAGLSVEEVRDVLVAVAPIIGSPRVLAAAEKITDALGVAVAVAVEEALARGELGPGQPPAAAGAPPGP
jgi:hypothetical protein